ncbi:MAG: hypothetical protein WBA38_14810 [Gordonia sp. (in: high G+C Gram-positive bacteria)]|uniref:hypothetical protein n=1 Tax=Gordonia sp. (in: high G+C Gram-positive bacteria) TaxID=84139 RepID=UPI003C78C2F2
MRMPEPTAHSVLLIRAVDTEPATYISFRWLDDPQHPEVHAIRDVELRRLVAQLDRALPGSDSGDGSLAIASALTGPFTRKLSEYALNEAIGRAVFPAVVRTAIVERSRRGSVTVRITPSRTLARMPLELAVIGDSRRLIEFADISYEPPAAIHAGRARIPEAWTDAVASRPVAYIVDPRLPAGSGLGQVLDWQRPGAVNAAVLSKYIAGLPHTANSGVGRIVGRWELSDDLVAKPSRLLYVGHISSTLDEPGSAAMHLTDDAAEWGYATVMNSAHLPFSALDLLLGTASPELGPADRSPVEPNRTGRSLWPMPPRVALIACEGGADYRSSETFGLVMAIFNAGAEIVTTSRWMLPSDEAFRVYCGLDSAPGPTTELALGVDATHRAADPVRALNDWQRSKFAQWQLDPGPATSPLTWAAMACHACPPRPLHRPHGAGDSDD